MMLMLSAKFGKAKVINLPLGFKISSKVVNLIIGQGGSNNVVDLDGEDGCAQVRTTMINAPFVFHAFETPASNSGVECLVPDSAHLFHSIDTFV